jgi:hypothetical protein
MPAWGSMIRLFPSGTDEQKTRRQRTLYYIEKRRPCFSKANTKIRLKTQRWKLGNNGQPGLAWLFRLERHTTS